MPRQDWICKSFVFPLVQCFVRIDTLESTQNIGGIMNGINERGFIGTALRYLSDALQNSWTVEDYYVVADAQRAFGAQVVESSRDEGRMKNSEMRRDEALWLPL
jgi:hypothetical protein